MTISKIDPQKSRQLRKEAVAKWYRKKRLDAGWREKQNEKRRQWRSNNPVALRAQMDRKNARLKQKRLEDPAWREKENVKCRDNQRRYKLKRQIARRAKKYGITQDQYEALLIAQDNSCAICRLQFTVSPVVDHCHKTNQVRGLLCSECNLAVGLLEDKAHLARRMADYIERGRKLRDLAAQKILPFERAA